MQNRDAAHGGPREGTARCRLPATVMKYSILTFGCRVNQADSLNVEAALRERHAVSTTPADADLVVVNTCSVTSSADQGARQTIRRVARENPSACIVVTGCYATRCPDELTALPGVVRVLPNDLKEGLVDTIGEDVGLTSAERFDGGAGPCGAPFEPGLAGRTALLLGVQTGCDERCTYCIIPSTRGRGRSRPLGAVVADVERAVAAGFQEIVLTGVHLGSYGRDLETPCALVDLLEALDRQPGRVLFRVSSLEPMDCTPAIVELIASSPRFAPHLHLPLQHGSDAILSAMGRLYSVSEYTKLLERIRSLMPAAALGSDLIVGFPGERDEDFQATVDYLERSPLTYVHVFPYSDRPGTPATDLRSKLVGGTIRGRAQVLRAVGASLAERFRRSQVGQVRAGLTLEDGTLVLTDNYLKVRIPPGRCRNEWVQVRIERTGETLTGALAV